MSEEKKQAQQEAAKAQYLQEMELMRIYEDDLLQRLSRPSEVIKAPAIDLDFSGEGYRDPYDLSEFVPAKAPSAPWYVRLGRFFVKIYRRLLPPPKLEDLKFEKEADDVRRNRRIG